MTARRGFAYAPGAWTCLTQWPVCLLIDLAPPDERLAELANLLAAAPTVEAVVDALSARGLSTAPSFGLIHVGKKQVRVVVHGQLHATLGGQPLASTPLIAEAASSLDSPVIIGDNPEGASLAITDGTAQASAVVWPAPANEQVSGNTLSPFEHLFGGAAGTGAPSPAAGGSKSEPSPATGAEPSSDGDAGPDPTGGRSGDEDPGRTQISPPTTSLADLHQELAAESAADQPAERDGREASPASHGREPAPHGREPSPAPPSAPVRRLPVFIDSFEWDPGAVSASPPHFVLPGPDAPQPSSVPSAGPADHSESGSPRRSASSGDHPASASARRSLSEVSGSADGDLSGGSGLCDFAQSDRGGVQSDRGGVPGGSSDRHDAPGLRVRDQDEPAVAVGGATESEPVPTVHSGPKGTVPVVPGVDLTVAKSSLLASNGEVMVVAVACPQGHYSPPYASVCRVCAAPLEQRHQAVEVLRPVLGILRLWGGGSVYLDRGVVFGRNPRPILGLAGPEPSLVRIEDPNRDVSSQHCEVRLEDWFVTVRDLNSTNGTQVLLPHRPPVTLRPQEPMVIEPGSRVILAQAFDFTFEVV